MHKTLALTMILLAAGCAEERACRHMAELCGKDTDTDQCTKQLKELDVNAKMFGTGGAVVEFHKALGKDAEFSYGLSAWEPTLPNPGIKEFVEDYKSQFNADPSFHAAGAYAGCQLFIEAARRANSLDSEKLREELLKLKCDDVTAALTKARDESAQEDKRLNTYIDLLDVRRGLFQAQIDLVAAQRDALLNTVDLALAVGGGLGERAEVLSAAR